MAKNGTNGSSKNGATPGNTWAGAARRGDGKIRVAIVGVGNCASSLVQGRYYYEDAKEDDFVPGLMHVNLGGYHVRDIEFVAAFDIDKNKVGKDLSEAIYTKPNNTYVFQQVPKTGVTVERGMTHDGLGKYLSQIIEKAPGPDRRHRRHPQGAPGRRDGVLPARRQRGSHQVVRRSRPSRAGVGFVNAIPVFIGREPYWQRRFAEAGLPLIGDDIKSQVGATISHRVLTRLFMDRGVRLDRTYQLNFGGNTDFLNMLERERLESKKISKTNAVTSMLDYELDDDDIHVGPSDHVPWLKDRKWCYIRMEGTTFGDVPLNAELKLEVWDSPNSAGVITDAIRCLKLGLDRGLKGTLVAPSSYFMKSPPHQIHDDIAFNRVEAFIRGEDNETLVGTEKVGQADVPQAGRHEGPGRDHRGEVTDGRGRPTGGVPGERRLEAPHRRGGSSPRVVERLAVVAYKATTRLADVVPARLARDGGRHRRPGLLPGVADQAALVEPQLRARPRAAARRPARPPAGAARLSRVRALPRRADAPADQDGRRDVRDGPVHRRRRAPPHRARPRGAGVIYTVGHVGNNDAVVAAIARHGLPISVVADDSSFPELFELLRAERELRGAYGHRVAQPARDLRRAAPARDARPARRLGLPPRRHPGPPLRRLDHAARRSRDARGEDRLADPAGHDPAPAG